MANRSYLLPIGITMLGVISTAFACSCKPNLKADACKSDYVIVAKVLGERQKEGSVSQYDLNITNVLKTSEQYQGAEKVMQAKRGGPAGCEVILQKDHTYIFSGHVGDVDGDRTAKPCLEVKYCNYVDLKDVEMNKELFKDIADMIENPPVCGKRNGIMERADQITSLNLPERGDDWNLPAQFQKRWNSPFHKRWNSPFHKRWSNPFQKRWGNPFQKRWGNPFQKRWGNPFQKRWGNPFQKRWGNPFQKSE